MERIALITPTHLARNPRLVKEADALAEAGYEVDVFYCRFDADVVPHDLLIEGRSMWRAHPLDYTRAHAPWTYWISRLRRHACRRIAARLLVRPQESSSPKPESGQEAIGPVRISTGLLRRVSAGLLRRARMGVLLRAYERVYPELLRNVRGHDADLYVAHNLQALPVAYHAARGRGARMGFDAEDFHTGMFPGRKAASLTCRLVAAVEARFIRSCDYVTAAAPLIARAYADRYGIEEPRTVLNTFPAAMRPAEFRPTSSGGPLTLYWFSQTIGPTRGLEDIVRALSLVPDVPAELHLRGSVHDAAYVDYLKELAGGAAGRIVLHGLAPADDMIRLSAAYDVGLALETPAEHNRDMCLSNKIFSYLAAGNAVLASGTTAQRALMEHIGPVGAVYAPGDAEQMAGWIRRWHESRDTLDDRRRAAWRAATDRYSWDIEKQAVLNVIEGQRSDRVSSVSRAA